MITRLSLGWLAYGWLELGWLAEDRTGLSRLIRRRAWTVIQGASWLGGRVPAKVSARAWANWLGQGPAAYRSAK